MTSIKKFATFGKAAPAKATVDTIIAPLKQQASDLDQFILDSYDTEDQLIMEREELRSRIEGLNNKIAATEAERNRARAIKGNIDSIIDLA